jgi:hypothetical protein
MNSGRVSTIIKNGNNMNSDDIMKIIADGEQKYE